MKESRASLLGMILSLLLTVCLAAGYAADPDFIFAEEAPENISVEPAVEAEEEPARADGEDSWTIAVYMCGSDLERDNSFASGDIREMLMADIPDNVNLLVLTGGAGQNGWSWKGDDDPDDKWGDHESVGYVTPEGTQIWRITHHKMTLLKEYEEYMDLRDKALMEEFFKFAVDYTDAKHMMSLFWNHGGGPIKGAEFTQDVNGADVSYARLNDIEEALENANEYRKETMTTGTG